MSSSRIVTLKARTDRDPDAPPISSIHPSPFSHSSNTMFRGVFTLSCLGAASAFAPSALLPTRTASSTSARPAAGMLQMQLEARSPVDIFEGMDKDGQDIKTSAFLRESEVKHGRLAMLAAVGYPVAEIIHPLLAGATNLPSFVTENGASPNLLNGGLQKLLESPFGIFFVLFAVGRAFELETSALRPRNNFLSKNPKEMYPYDLGFDPLGFHAKATPDQRKIMAEKELNNGRLAMLAISAYPFVEYMSKSPIAQLADAASE